MRPANLETRVEGSKGYALGGDQRQAVARCDDQPVVLTGCTNGPSGQAATVVKWRGCPSSRYAQPARSGGPRIGCISGAPSASQMKLASGIRRASAAAAEKPLGADRIGSGRAGRPQFANQS